MENNKLDKRTKEYKEWKANFDKKSKGLGDDIEKITEATGIKAVVKAVFGEDCGCEERKEMLNKVFPKNNIECLEESEYNFLTDLFDNYKGNTLPHSKSVTIMEIHNRVFNQNKDVNTKCSSCINNVFVQLRKIIEVYSK